MCHGTLNEVNVILITYWKQIVKKIFVKKKKDQGRLINSFPIALDSTKNTSLHGAHLNELARKFDGKLLTRREISVNEPMFQFLLAESLFHPTSSIQKSFLSLPTCQRCNNTKKSLFANIPCARCDESHYYCRKCIAMGRVMECEPLYYWTGRSYSWPKMINPCSWTGTLTKAQENAAGKIVDAVSQGEELLVWAVTGAGKTEMLFPGITKALEQGKRVCISTPRADVVRELLPRLQQAFASIHIQGLFSGSRDNDGTAQLIIATTHQLLRYRHAFDVLIIDEIDAFPYHHDASLQFAANRAKKENASLIYLTATPRDEQRARIASKKLEHVFVPLRFHGHSLPIPSMIHCTSITKKLPPQFLTWIKNRVKRERQLLVFVPTIKLANDLKTPLAELLIAEELIFLPSEIEHVHAEDKNREEKILAFRKKKIYALITTTILERGVTFPSVDVAVLYAGHQVFDEAALIQISGRAGRSPEDPTGEVIFFHDGQTNSMVHAVKSIKQMNRRAENFKKKKGEK